MVTSEHLNALLKNIFNLIKKTVGEEDAPWMVNIAGNLFFFLYHETLINTLKLSYFIKHNRYTQLQCVVKWIEHFINSVIDKRRILKIFLKDVYVWIRGFLYCTFFSSFKYHREMALQCFKLVECSN